MTILSDLDRYRTALAALDAALDALGPAYVLARAQAAAAQAPPRNAGGRPPGPVIEDHDAVMIRLFHDHAPGLSRRDLARLPLVLARKVLPYDCADDHAALARRLRYLVRREARDRADGRRAAALARLNRRRMVAWVRAQLAAAYGPGPPARA
jgi:hypothetical protein